MYVPVSLGVSRKIILIIQVNVSIYLADDSENDTETIVINHWTIDLCFTTSSMNQ
jgi:hypothetical protein